ncbi:hypothetical protein G7067_04885 [Leucobacter insecticola]|uniref:Htaa domain-containing protein n=2 Tax=Leucobacter insecticola TaxID=2714934 RepID=A0A6G8FM04_9MICO|nr:hypothetical protein G7067_04885 [Leucobacter insecticola]
MHAPSAPESPKRAGSRAVRGRSLGLACAIGLGVLGSLGAPVFQSAPAAEASPLVAEGSGSVCQVTSADLSWGVKESFRSYISGSIANGEWTVDNGAAYETPHFKWVKDSGEISPDLAASTLSFVGGVHFTGHGGALRMDLANPTIEFVDTETAYLLLDFGATDTALEGAPVSTQLRAAKIEMGPSLQAQDDKLTLTDATVRLTAEGAAAFNGGYGDYASGAEMDPISLTATVTGCELGEVVPDAPMPVDTEPQGELVAADPQQVPWLPIIIGGVAILVIGVTAGMLFAGRKRPATEPVVETPTSTD